MEVPLNELKSIVDRCKNEFYNQIKGITKTYSKKIATKD